MAFSHFLLHKASKIDCVVCWRRKNNFKKIKTIFIFYFSDHCPYFLLKNLQQTNLDLFLINIFHPLARGHFILSKSWWALPLSRRVSFLIGRKPGWGGGGGTRATRKKRTGFYFSSQVKKYYPQAGVGGGEEKAKWYRIEDRRVVCSSRKERICQWNKN